MTLLLTDSDIDLSVDVRLSKSVYDLLGLQWQRLETPDTKEMFAARISTGLEQAVLEAVDWDLRRPSTAQISYATAIALKLGLDVPADVLRFRGAMGDFIDAHSEAFKQAQFDNKR